MKQTRAERIMTEDEVQALLQAPISARNRAFLYLLYAAGLRVSESVSLRWRDVVARDNGTVQITVFGKGGKRGRYWSLKPPQRSYNECQNLNLTISYSTTPKTPRSRCGGHRLTG